jgi:hypothetical protein
LWPHIAHPKNDAKQRVNATLTRLNNEFVKSLRDCDAGVLEFEKEAGEPENTKDDLTCSREITMRGPRFLSMVATDEVFCGGGHPDDDLTVLVFDKETGAEVDWSSLVSKSAGASSRKDILGDASGTRPLMLPQLQAMYMASEDADADCKGSLMISSRCFYGRSQAHRIAAAHPKAKPVRTQSAPTVATPPDSH